MSYQVQIVSDGSASEQGVAACAAILRISGEVDLDVPRYLKTLLYLGEADSAESELWGGVLGCGLARLYSSLIPASELLPWDWCTDHKPSRDGVSKYLSRWKSANWIGSDRERIKLMSLWQVLEVLQGRNALTVSAPTDTRKQDHRRCDQGSRWARKEGGVLLAKQEANTLIGKNAARDPKNAWWFGDGRSIVHALRQGEAVEEVSRQLLELLRPRFGPEWPRS